MLVSLYLDQSIIKKLVPGNNWCLFTSPLKNINVWSDGGIITTNNKNIFNKIKLLRNHGLKDRDHVHLLGYNSRLDTFYLLLAIGFCQVQKNCKPKNQKCKIL